MKRNPSRPVLAGLLLLAAVAGCSKKENPPAPPQPKKAEPAKPAQKPGAPVQKQLSSATPFASHLDFRNRTDPFKPLAPAVAPPPAAAAAASASASARPSAVPSADLLPIQSYEVGKFKVAGIIAGLRENRALLIDPAGKGYVVQQGMAIGSNNGRISRITASSVEVVETVKADNGRIRKRKIVLTLAKKR